MLHSGARMDQLDGPQKNLEMNDLTWELYVPHKDKLSFAVLIEYRSHFPLD